MRPSQFFRVQVVDEFADFDRLIWLVVESAGERHNPVLSPVVNPKGPAQKGLVAVEARTPIQNMPADLEAPFFRQGPITAVNLPDRRAGRLALVMRIRAEDGIDQFFSSCSVVQLKPMTSFASVATHF